MSELDVVVDEVAARTPSAAVEAPVASAAKRLGVSGYLAVGWLTLVTAAAVLAPVLPLKDPQQSFPLRQGLTIKGPGTPGHLLGGDAIGRDLLSRMVWGGRASLLLGVASVALGMLIGGTLGMLAGYFRGKASTVVTGLLDTLLAIPQIVLALTLVAVLAPSDNLNPVSGTRRIVVLIVALGVVSIPQLARIARATTLSWAGREFVTAAKAVGATDRRILVREVLPNVLPALFSIGLLGVAVVIVAEGGLSLLGVGIVAPTPSWGNVLAEGYPTMRLTPWPILVPSTVIFLTVLSLNLLGDVVRARFDAKEARL